MGWRPGRVMGAGAQAAAIGMVLLVLAVPARATPASATAPAAAVPGSAVPAATAPAHGAAMPMSPVNRYTAPVVRHNKPTPLVDINSAPLAELEALPGIGEARAKAIIAKRPYHSKAQLVTAGVLPAGVYQSVRHMIIAIQPGPTRPSKHP